MKNNFWKIFLISFMLFSLSWSVFAAETIELDLKTAVNIALKNDLDLQIAGVDLEKAKLEYEKNKASNLTQNSRYNELQAEISMDSAENTYQKTEAQIITDTLNKYTDIWLAGYDLKIKEKQLALEKRLLKEARSQYEIGDIGEVDLLEKENDYKDADFALTTAIDNYEQNIKEFKDDLNITDNKITLAALDFNEGWQIEEDEAITLALENSIDIVLQKKRVQLAEIDLERAEISSARLDKKIKEKNLQSARLEERKTISQLINEVQNTYYQFEQIIKKITINHKRLEEAEEKYKLKKRQFEVGLLTNRELKEYELNMMKAEYDYLSTIADYYLKEQALRQKMSIKSGVLTGETTAE